MIPNSLVRIQLGRVRWKAMSANAAIASQELPDDPRIVMDVDPVPDNRQGPLNLESEASEKSDDVFGVDVSVVLEELEVKTQAVTSWAHGDGADRRDSIVSIPTLLDWRLSPRRVGAAYQRCEHEAGFIEEN